MHKQKTIKRVIHGCGLGLHSGKEVRLSLHPAPENTGIIFRTEHNGKIVDIPAKSEFVSDSKLATTLSKGTGQVFAVEHLTSALSGLQIDNLLVHILGQEIPIMDGSSSVFVFMIESAGIQEQNALRKYIKIKKEISVNHNGEWVRIEPQNKLESQFTIDFEHKPVKQSSQTAFLSFSTTTYLKELSRARNFSFISDIKNLKQEGFAQGANLDNVVVLDQEEVLNEDGLRYCDELVRHKMLDAIGDLYLIGFPIIGKFTAYQSGHTLNHRLIKKLLASQDAWEIITLT